MKYYHASPRQTSTKSEHLCGYVWVRVCAGHLRWKFKWDAWAKSCWAKPCTCVCMCGYFCVFACVLWSKYKHSFLCVIQPCCAEPALCVRNNACDSDLQLREGPPSCVCKCVDPPASCDKAQFELTDTHTFWGAGMFGCSLCWPHLQPPWPAECCMRPSGLIHSASAQTCHQMIYILHWHLYPTLLTSIQSIFHPHMQWDISLRTGK